MKQTQAPAATLAISPRTRAYLRLSRASRWLPSQVDGLYRALWLGLLDADELNQVTSSQYEMSDFGDAIWNSSQGLWPWETDAVRDAFSGCRRVLVTSAGGGREAIALCRLGFEVTAFDSSPALADACRTNARNAGAAINVFDAPPDRLPGGIGPQDGIFIGRGSYHHIPGRDRRVQFLRECRALVNEGAPIIVSDFFARSHDSSSLQKIQRIANRVRALRGSTARVELGDWLSGCLQHAFDRDEIEAELQTGGFTVQRYSVSPFGDESRLAHVVGSASARV